MLNSLEFVTASIDPKVLGANLLKSKALQHFGLTVQNGYNNIPKAYNDAKTQAQVVCYLHDDVYLPETFIPDLMGAMLNLPDDWEVLGVAGVTGPPKQNHGYISDRGKKWGDPIETPVKVDTLDELLLITRGSIVFDENLPLDFYGADICIGRKAYVIPAFVNHNSSRPFGGRTQSFYDAERYFRNKHLNSLPIVTTCSQILL